MASARWAVWPGWPHPLGATWDGSGVNFALFSAHASKVELCLFDREGRREIERVALPECTDEVWHGYLPEAYPGLLYGYRVHGPYEPSAGHRFNPAKLLIDPYAKMLRGALHWSDAHFGYRLSSGREDLSFDRRDNARGMPKCAVIDEAYTWGADRPPGIPWGETITYETHLRGMTMLHPAIPEHLRGTFAGLGNPAVIDHLVALGITAIELLPIHAFVQDRHLLANGRSNYWGYNSIGFFAPEPRYLAGGAVGEFKTMVKRFHNAGIEVILDVVYNHTAEGNHLGPTLSFKGIDNATYYRLLPDNPRLYIDDTGTGNTINMSHPRVLQMVTDSLRYWVEEMHVDGFRFDLAATLGREQHGFDPNGGFFGAIRQDRVLGGVKLIAEPWDIGPGGYQVGNFPPGWFELNDRFRDVVRQFWKGDEGILPELAARLTASADLFERRGRRAWTSVNKITSHDGFTLKDVVSYNHKHNEANGENNQDGHNANYSWNHGVEGATEDPAITALRARQMRNLMATLLLSQGTPMLLGGDEFGRTQLGNNNAYCQDNEINWFDWEAIGEDGRLLIEFTRRLIALRKAHPVLRRTRFLHGREVSGDGVKDITWFSPKGTEKTAAQWQDRLARCLGLMLNGKAGQYRTPEGAPADDEVLLIVLNAHHDIVPFTLPATVGGVGWRRVLDTTEAAPSVDPAVHAVGNQFPIPGRSLILFVCQPA
ncbi:MAG: glgX1 [Geminicoccaceae bacterium]|jgi:glycogen operon protein|nr:glgX1 [Geminicoccaceae bacterium]